MILLDTDHVTVLRYPEDRRHAGLTARPAKSEDRHFGVTAVSVEEQMRGWLSFIARARDVHAQIPAYDRLIALFEFFAEWDIVPFDAPAADEFVRLRRAGVRIATMDLKIAAIACVRDARLLSANRSDFGKVSGLKLENWIG